jgi:hypothetical protein
MQKKSIVLVMLFAAILIVSTILTLECLNSDQSATPEIYVGVEMAYSNATFNDVKDLVDKVKNYTNLIVIGSPEISINQSALNKTCDYISQAGLKFIILFTRMENYTTYDHFAWVNEAQKKYGDKFLAVYRFDEPGGRQIDQSTEMLITEATNYSDASTKFTETLGFLINYYQNLADRVITSEYALHWFDYKSNYSAVLTQFIYNNTREIAIAQCRGAAAHFRKGWGTIITWKYSEPPYIESGEELYSDMVTAYKTGSKYIVVFNYPKLDKYGLLTEEHFDALKRFWNYLHDNPKDFGIRKGKAVYVLPQDYGFGLRRPDDRIWGLFGPDELSAKVWSDIKLLVETYGFDLDILYDEPGVVDSAKNRYERLFFWNKTIDLD